MNVQSSQKSNSRPVLNTVKVQSEVTYSCWDSGQTLVPHFVFDSLGGDDSVPPYRTTMCPFHSHRHVTLYPTPHSICFPRFLTSGFRVTMFHSLRVPNRSIVLLGSRTYFSWKTYLGPNRKDEYRKKRGGRSGREEGYTR